MSTDPKIEKEEEPWWWGIWQEWYATIIIIPVVIIGSCIFCCVYRSYVYSDDPEEFSEITPVENQKGNLTTEQRKAKYQVNEDVNIESIKK